MLSNLSRFLPEVYLSAYDNLEFLLRIVIAAFLGAAIGSERKMRDKGAGIRTHCIIAVTSAVFMIISKYAFIDLVDINGSRGADNARIAAQVVSGISFLGAGIIFKQGRASVRGLTTAAGMWATASIGLTIGAGLYWLAFFATGLLLFLQYFLHKHSLGVHTLTEQEIKIKMKDEKETLDDFHNFIKQRRCVIEDSTIHRSSSEGTIEIRLAVRVDPPIEYEETLDFMRDHPQVSRFSA
ncbi:MAG: MgtC/SapB family protein [Eubacterium sp.]|nr:MgtC/SapB family protein [Eubacterium sp.]